MTIHRRTAGFLILIFAIALSACASPVPPAPTPGVDNTPTALPTEEAATPVSETPLKVLVAPYLSYAPFYIALEEGYFAEQGLAIEIVQVARPRDAIPALVQGQLDVAGINMNSALLNAMVREGQIRMVASMAQELRGKCAFNGAVLRLGVAVGPDGQVPVEALPSLRYYFGTASTVEYALDTWLGLRDLTVKDVTAVDLPGGTTILEPLQQGTVDVAWLTEPWISRARDAGAADLWIALADVLPQVQNSVVAFGPTLLHDNPAAGERFMMAYLQGVRRYNEGKTERNLEILEKSMELDRAQLEKMCFPYIPADGAILPQSVVEFSQWAAAHDYIDGPLTPEMFWESRFVDHADAALGAP